MAKGGPITDKETRLWRETQTLLLRQQVQALAQINSTLAAIYKHLFQATHFSATIASEPLSTHHPGGVPMPDPIAGVILPNCRAVVTVVPLSADGVPTALDGNLQAIFVEPAVFTIDSTDPLSMIVKVDPPADIDAQPQTHCTISDDKDSDPTLELIFDWQKAVIIVKATQFNATITSEPLA